MSERMGDSMEVVDAEVVEPGQDLERRPDPSTQATLFRTDDPVQVIERATAAADALKGVLVKQNLTVRIQGKEHVLVEGWSTLGSMLGVVPVVEWSRPLPGDKGWEARVEARTLDGRVVGAAEAECTRDEKRWKSADDYAVRSMAQTRATSKALRGPLGFIVTLAGFSATPAEEMPSEPQGSDWKPGPRVDGVDLATAAQVKLMKFKAKGLDGGQKRDILSALGVEKIEQVPKAKVDDALKLIEAAK